MARNKYVERFCAYCNRQSKMEIVGGMEGVADKTWFKCTRCRHLTLLASDPNGLKSSGKSGAETEVATPYNPKRNYIVGEAIFHTDWDDVGKVMSKVKTSSGGQAIIVAFEKNGERRLIENLKAERPIEDSLPQAG